jgi:hypothetical protein
MLLEVQEGYLKLLFFLSQANMTQAESPGLDLDLHNALVNMSREMLTAAQSVLRPTPMPGRNHYLFTLKDIAKCFQVQYSETQSYGKTNSYKSNLS